MAGQTVRHHAALSLRVSAWLALGVALALGSFAVLTTRGAVLAAKLLWAIAIGTMACRVFVTGRVGRWRSTFFIILALAFIVHFKATLIGLTGRAFVTPDVQEVPYCHIAIASSSLNHVYQQYLAFMSGAWRHWSPLTWGALWLGVTLVLGQAWCSWACCYGGLDSCFAKMAPKPRVVWHALPRGLRDLPAAILVAMMLLSLVALKPIFCLWVCPLKLGTGFLDPNHLTRQLQLVSFAAIGTVFLVALPWLTKKRTFCGLICPFGAWQAFFGRINPYRVTITPERCVQCQRCITACPTFAIDSEGLKDHRISAYCNRCGECMDACPTGAIDYTLVGASRALLPPGASRTLFLLSAWLVAGSVSMLFVPDAIVTLWRWAAG